MNIILMLRLYRRYRRLHQLELQLKTLVDEDGYLDESRPLVCTCLAHIEYIKLAIKRLEASTDDFRIVLTWS